jgi:methylenetetrahydrofolate dehydrogenase (NADP+) / methenyltetrahydrofolate cyclohydrolase
MTATVMDGRALAAQIKDRLKPQVDSMKDIGACPVLATIVVGDDPASKQYVASKNKAAQEVGIVPESYELPEDTSSTALSQLIRKLSADHKVNGIMLELPLPHHLDYRVMIEQIAPEKDVDGLTTTNLGRLFDGRPQLVPATPLGIVTLLHRYEIPIACAEAVIINRSILLGKPLYHLLLAEDATVTTCHSKSKHIDEHTKGADILVTAVGTRPNFVLTADMVKEGAVVIDAGTNKEDGKTEGDVDFEAVSRKASFITPVPGGVGPMTIAMLLQNTVEAATNQLTSRSVVTPAGQVEQLSKH